MSLPSYSHDITPQRGSIRKAFTGQPVDGLTPSDYPLVAVCLVCGHAIRIERYWFSEWYHTGKN